MEIEFQSICNKSSKNMSEKHFKTKTYSIYYLRRGIPQTTEA